MKTRTIEGYPLSPSGITRLQLPKGSVALQPGILSDGKMGLFPCLWIELPFIQDDNNPPPLEGRSFVSPQAGQAFKMPEHSRYIGSVLFTPSILRPGDVATVHVYETTAPVVESQEIGHNMVAFEPVKETAPGMIPVTALEASTIAAGHDELAPPAVKGFEDTKRDWIEAGEQPPRCGFHFGPNDRCIRQAGHDGQHSDGF